MKLRSMTYTVYVMRKAMKAYFYHRSSKHIHTAHLCHMSQTVNWLVDLGFKVPPTSFKKKKKRPTKKKKKKKKKKTQS